MKDTIFAFAMAVLIFCAAPCNAQEGIVTAHAIAMHGSPKYGPDFTHFDYVNPAAQKGGKVLLNAIGTFDTLNSLTLKGVSATGLGLIYDTLLISSEDEAFTEYGLLAKTIEVPEDRSWVAFTLRDNAKWHDGAPVTVEDVIFTLNTLKSKGHPFYRAYYANVTDAQKIEKHKVKFLFSEGENRELPLIVGQMPIIPQHFWKDRDFEKTSLDIPLGSGPYRINSFDQGRSITYNRVDNYWGQNLPVNKGRFNFGQIRYDYYRDSTVALQAFKAGEYDFRVENSSKDWATSYEIPDVKNRLILKENIPHENPTGMQAFVMNIRRPFFKDSRVRHALAYAFDFEWTNKNLFYSQYTRTKSFFSNSELASNGLPGIEELKILEQYKGRIPEELFHQKYEPPITDGSGSIRNNLRKAFKLLKEAGWTIKDRKLIEEKTGKPLTFEILLNSPIWERISLPYAKNLERLGIEAKVRTVDAAQYQKRVEAFDFDMIVDVFSQSLSPGNEQRDFWGSNSSDLQGSRNTIGIKDPVVDELIDLIISAPDRKSLISRTQALDRVLLWGHYVIPHWHITSYRVAYWDKFGRPESTPKYGLGLFTWWVDNHKERNLKLKKASR